MKPNLLRPVLSIKKYFIFCQLTNQIHNTLVLHFILKSNTIFKNYEYS
jgi:hypothetical protein